MSKPNPEPSTAERADDWGSRRHVRTLVLMGATVFGIYLCYRLAAPFLPALVWASALAVLFAPLQGWLESKLRWPTLAAAVCVLIIAVIVVAPVTIVAERLVVQAAKGAQLVERKVASGEWQRTFSAQPQMGKAADRIARRIDLADAVKSATDRLGASAGRIAKGSLLQVAGVVLIVIAFGDVHDQMPGLDEPALAVGMGGKGGPITGQGQAQRLGQAVHRIGGEHART